MRVKKGSRQDMKQAMMETLQDAGCTKSRAQNIEQLCRAGQIPDALHQMKILRCDLIEEIHQSQRKLDCLDFLIRDIEKEMKKTDRER